jgi:SNF2 family DNA or RNA helicase
VLTGSLVAKGDYKSWRDAGHLKVKERKRDADVWVEGRFIMYAPTFHPSPEVKEWGGVRWDGKNQAWRIPRITRNAKKIVEFDPDARLTRDVKRLLDDSIWDVPAAQVPQRLVEVEIHPRFNDLYEYQMQALFALISRPYHGKMLILSPGLGKTPTSIVAADVLSTSKNNPSPKYCVVAPLSLTWNWVREIEAWSSTPDVIRVHGKQGVGEATWTVTNPESLFERARATEGAPLRATGHLDPLFDIDWDLVILDESILYKNRKSKRSSIVKTLSRASKQVWELSGAPITHDNSDLWQQMNIAEPDYFPAFWKFANEFCVVERTPWSQGEIVGSRHGISLRAEYPELLFVRNQEEVFNDLPSVIFQDLELPLTRRQKKAHDDIMDQWFHELEYNADSRIDVTAVIAQLTRLQQVTSNLKNLETTGKHWPDESTKADAVEQLIETQAIEGPTLIWVWHRPGAHALFDRLKRAADGKTAEKTQHPLYGKRVEMVLGGNKNADKIIEAYKNGEVEILIMSIGVGKYGHTLANTRTIIYFDRTWDSDAIFQSLHRYAGARGRLAGYEHNPVCIIMRCRGTVDDFVEMNLAGKLPDMANITGADLLKILRSLGANYIEDLEDAA